MQKGNQLSSPIQRHLGRCIVGFSNNALIRKGVDMAAPAFRQFEGTHPSMYLAGPYVGFLPATPQSAVSHVPQLPIDLGVPQDALNGAKGAVAAIGVEIGPAIFLYGLWLIWHLLR